MEKLVKLLDDFNRDLSPYAGEAKYTIWDDNVELAKYLTANNVRQVVRGQWLKINPRKDVEGWTEYDFQCSICKEISWEESNYCPNCGADMREGNK